MELDTAGETFGEVPRPQVLAWHSDPDLKAEALMRMKTHQVQDEITRGYYFSQTDAKIGSGFKGCFHGCLTSDKYMQENKLSRKKFNRMLNAMDLDARGDQGGWYHGQGELIWGIPEDLGGLLDVTFESIDGPEEAAMFAVESIEAMAVGADLTGVVQALDDADTALYNNDREAWYVARSNPMIGARAVLQMLREAPVPNQES